MANAATPRKQSAARAAGALRLRPVREAIGRCRALIRERGEAAGSAAARDALAAYQALDEAQRRRFFDALAQDFSPDPKDVLQAANAYHDTPTPRTLARLQAVVEPARQELFRRLNMAPGATTALIDMRRQVMLERAQHPQWDVIEEDLRHLLRSWFNRGFLKLERIDWHTSAIVLEKLIKHEAVHQIQGWGDLRRRLQADRRCFAFFHPQLPDDPLIFIEVALTRAMSAKVQPLLEVNSAVASPELANCAIFYSITNCQEGMRGVSFGNFLIKQVAIELKREFPRIRRFATLSPVVGFRPWLLAHRERWSAGAQGAALRMLLKRVEAAGSGIAAIAGAEELLLPLCAYYLTQARRGDELLDPVARFHLGNGAVLERLNWLGDTSAHGMARSFGLMVNYVYRLAEVERNHELFVNEHRIIASAAVLRAAGAAGSWLNVTTGTG